MNRIDYLRKLLAEHGVQTMTANGRLYAEEVSNALPYFRQHVGWTDITGWSVHRVKTWLGY